MHSDGSDPRSPVNDATAMDAPSVGDANAAVPLGEAPGTRIGPYRLLQLIGEGGFGSVFMAEQERPVARRVALKIIKRGMDTRQVVARFEQERQALALMDHPHIAKVLDAGETETGRPYFVMELCKGDPIVAYCDKHNLAIEARLELVAQVCSAVQHAHTKGIIHRDLKPSNILVSTQDGRASAKVIDFGIAKATASKLTDKTLFTEHHAFIGTPEYMSPEQAEGSLDIDTRTDVYSLGVLLYELLTGTTPFSGQELRSAAYAELQRIIREVEPPKPSTRLSAQRDTIAHVAARRQTEPRRLGALLRGDLDWIVMKALEKDRHRRFETANDLALDIRRYLAGDAVLAAPPSMGYRLRKFVGRHRIQVTAASAVFVALMAGMAGTAWQAKVASENARAARDAETAANAARDAERARADELKLVSDFQASMLAGIDATLVGARLTKDVNQRFAAALEKANLPEAERDRLTSEFRAHWGRVNATDAAVALIDETILKPAVKAIDAQFKEQPVIDAQLGHALAVLNHSLGRYGDAQALQARTLEIRRRVLGEEHPATLLSLHDMGVLMNVQGRYAEAEPFVREAMDKRRRLLGEEHPHTLISIHVMGALLFDLGRFDESEVYSREVVEKSRRVHGEEHPSTLMYINSLGALLASTGKFAEAEPYLRDGLAISRRVLGEEHLNTLQSIQNMAGLLRANNKVAEAEPYCREALEKYRRVRGEEHPQTLVALKSLGAVLRTLERNDEAEPYLRESFEVSRRVLGEDHPETLNSARSYGVLLASQEKLAEAEAIFRDTLNRSRRALGDDHPSTLGSLNNLGAILVDQQRLSEAEDCFRESLERHRRLQGDDHSSTRHMMLRLFFVLRDQEKFADAETLGRECLTRSSAQQGAGHPTTLRVTVELASVVLKSGQHRAAAELLEPVESAVRRAFERARPMMVAQSLTTLARARLHDSSDLELYRRAEEQLLEAHGLLIAATRSDSSEAHLRDCVEGLVELYTAWHRVAPGQGYDQKANEWRAKAPPAQAASGQRS